METALVIAVVVRQQAWFRSFVDPKTVGPFEPAKASYVRVEPVGSYRARVLMGHGPVQYDLPPTPILWFGHGEQEYPVFQCPSIGPSGAAVYLSMKPRNVGAAQDDVLCLIEISAIHPVPTSFQQRYEEELKQHPTDLSP